jgi:hypothetical protein
MVRDETLRGLDPEALGEDGAERLHLHLAESGKLLDPAAEVVRVGGVTPDCGGVPTVPLDHERAELLDATSHVARKSVNRGSLPEDRVEQCRVGRGDLARVERPEPLLQLERPRERRLYGHLLVEREADQEGERVLGEECVCRIVAREVERARYAWMLEVAC